MSGGTHVHRALIHLGSSPTGLSPAPAGRSRTVPLTVWIRARDQSLSPAITYYPHETAPTGSYAPWVWAPPVSLAATPGILSFPRGTEMFQFPRCPPCAGRVTAHHGRRVAPFGDRGITGCQPLPRAFRRVAASFLGCRRQGIHRPPILAELFVAPPNAPPSPTRAMPPGHPGSFGPRQVTALTSTFILSLLGIGSCLHACVQPASLRSHRSSSDCQRASVGRATWVQVAMMSCQSAVRIVENKRRAGLPRAGGAAGTRTPDLRRAKAALSQLSYGPSSRLGAPVRCSGSSCRASGGRAWTRTRDLGLIRAAL